MIHSRDHGTFGRIKLTRVGYAFLDTFFTVRMSRRKNEHVKVVSCSCKQIEPEKNFLPHIIVQNTGFTSLILISYILFVFDLDRDPADIRSNCKVLHIPRGIYVIHLLIHPLTNFQTFLVYLYICDVSINYLHIRIHSRAQRNSVVFWVTSRDKLYSIVQALLWKKRDAIGESCNGAPSS